jgi:hypothetical protein
MILDRFFVQKMENFLEMTEIQCHISKEKGDIVLAGELRIRINLHFLIVI